MYVINKMHKQNGIWRSVKHEPNTKTCAMNLLARIPELSTKNNFGDCRKEWTAITGMSYDKNTELCLCGMRIYKEKYFFYNKLTDNTALIGCNCCKRINFRAVKKFKESLKKRGVCWVCNTNHKDLDTHYDSINHLQKLKGLKRDFHWKLVLVISKKLEKINKEITLINKLKLNNKCIEEKCLKYIPKTEPEWKVRCLHCHINYLKSKNPSKLIPRRNQH